MTKPHREIGCPNCGLKFTVPTSLAGRILTCPSCKIDFQTAPPLPNQSGSSTGSKIEAFIDTTQKKAEELGRRIVSPATPATKNDTWGTVGTIAGFKSIVRKARLLLCFFAFKDGRRRLVGCCLLLGRNGICNYDLEPGPTRLARCPHASRVWRNRIRFRTSRTDCFG